MAMITYPLNNVEYTAEDAELYNSTRTSGVYSGFDFDWSLTGEDNSITVGKGLAWIKNGDFSGKVVAHKEPETFDFGIAPLSNGRVDVLSIRFSSVENGTSLVIKKGVEDGSFEIPERSTSEGVYELYLFAVRRNAGALQITASDITDLRDDRNYCGYMSEAVKDGYAPSLMEHNKGADFRFWVGTEEEYEEQKDNLPPNTFCLTTGGSVILKSWQDVDEITDVGWYRFNGGISAGGVTANYAYMRVDGYNEKQATQTLYLVVGGNRRILRRHLITSVWEKEWAWITPELDNNKEYKTTEQWGGKPVYTQRTTFNADAYKEFRFSFDVDIVRVVRSYVNDDIGNLPRYSAVGDLAAHAIISTKTGLVRYYNIGNNSGGLVSVQIWYVKD